MFYCFPRVCAIFLLGIIFSACEGPVGPEGPQGPAGPQGERGPAGYEIEVVNLTMYSSNFEDFRGEGLIQVAVYRVPEITSKAHSDGIVIVQVCSASDLCQRTTGLPSGWDNFTRTGEVAVLYYGSLSELRSTLQTQNILRVTILTPSEDT